MRTETRAKIEAMEIAASTAGDLLQAAICQIALNGEPQLATLAALDEGCEGLSADHARLRTRFLRQDVDGSEYWEREAAADDCMRVIEDHEADQAQREVRNDVRLVKGCRYDVGNLLLRGWTRGDGASVSGHQVAHYFGRDGVYRGADEHGIEPIVEGRRCLLVRVDEESMGDDWDHVGDFCVALRDALAVKYPGVDITVAPERETGNGGRIIVGGFWEGETDAVYDSVRSLKEEIFSSGSYLATGQRVTIYRDTRPEPGTMLVSAPANPEWTGEILWGPRSDGLYWAITNRPAGVSLYLCRKTAKPGTYEWLAFRDPGNTYHSRAEAILESRRHGA